MSSTSLHPTPTGDEMSEASEEREIFPFKIINRGEDTIVGDDDNVVFSDFSPRTVPADVPDSEIDGIVSPKEESAPEPAASPVSTSTPPTEPTLSATPAQTPASEEGGSKNQAESTSQSSSSSRKAGQSEQPA